jgi:hypothetical protein
VLEALEKLKGGMKFPEVAAQYSEDKARQGVWIPLFKHILLLIVLSSSESFIRSKFSLFRKSDIYQ